MTNTAVLDHKGDEIDIVLEVIEAQKQQDESYHLIAPNSRFIGVLRNTDEDYQFSSTVESDGDRLTVNLPDEVAEGFLEEVDITGGE